jgi:hypothetical protein
MQQTDKTSRATTYTLFLMLIATEHWLSLSRSERRRLSDAHVGTSLQTFSGLRLRYFDAEAFTADCSDLMMIETEDLTAYYDFIETLRDSPMFTVPYFRVVRIIPTIEDGFRQFEDRASPA